VHVCSVVESDKGIYVYHFSRADDRIYNLRVFLRPGDEEQDVRRDSIDVATG